MISKGCTIGNTFTIPFTKEEIEVLYITYQQRGKTIIEKTIDDCTFGEGFLSTGLTQEETLMFESLVKVRIQIRARLKDGTATKSKIIETDVDTLLKDGVI